MVNGGSCRLRKIERVQGKKVMQSRLQEPHYNRNTLTCNIGICLAVGGGTPPMKKMLMLHPPNLY